MEYKGYWFLPSNPQKKVAGVLTYTKGRDAFLELIGCFEESSDEASEKCGKVYEIIYGITSDAKDITLFQSMQTNYENASNSTFPIIRYDTRLFIIGKHSSGLDEKCQYRATILIPALSNWCYPNAIEENNDILNGIPIRKSISYHVQLNDEFNTIAKVSINPYTSIAIKRNVIYESDIQPTLALRQYTYLEIEKTEASSIEELLSDIILFEQFLSLSTLGVVYNSEITLYDNKLYEQLFDHTVYTPIELIFLTADRKSHALMDIQSYDFLFTYQAVKEQYSEIIKKWYNENKDIEQIRLHLIKSLERKGTYSSVDFLIVIQAVEGFYRRFRNNKWRKEHNLPGKSSSDLFPILQELITEFSDIVLLTQIKFDIDIIVDTRIFYSHLMPKESKPKAVDGVELYKITCKLRVLLICCILSLSGFEHSQINEILNNSNSETIKNSILFETEKK